MYLSSLILFLYLSGYLSYIILVFKYQKARKNAEHPVGVICVGFCIWWLLLPRMIFSDDKFLKNGS
jgi:hypothetical protein